MHQKYVPILMMISAAAPLAAAADDSVLRLQMSPYTQHFHKSDDYHNVVLVGVELERDEKTLQGIAFFKNSFAQPTLYVYPWGGIHRDLFGFDHLFFKWTVGVLYGYKGKYEHKVPLNHHGFSPAIIPGIGYEFSSGFSAQINLLGTSGVMFQISKDL